MHARTTPSLKTTYVHLRDDLSGAEIPVTSDFWPSLMEGRRTDVNEGRLVTQMTSTSDWGTWERHPAGEELVVLLAGEARVWLDVDGEHSTVELARPGDFVLVPQGVWHTADVATQATFMVITPGKGTEHRPR